MKWKYGICLMRNRRPLGKQAGRREPIVKGEFHIVVVVCVINEQNEILLTLRSPDKEKYPGNLENTGGALEAGEESRTAAVRELFEETGIRVRKNQLHLLDSQMEESAFIDVYVVRKSVPVEKIRLQEGETVDARWLSLYEFCRLGEEEKIAPPIYRRFCRLKGKLDVFIREESRKERYPACRGEKRQESKKMIIIGCSGSGKSTLAKKLGRIMDLPVVYLDAFSLGMQDGSASPLRSLTDLRRRRSGNRSGSWTAISLGQWSTGWMYVIP